MVAPRLFVVVTGTPATAVPFDAPPAAVELPAPPVELPPAIGGMAVAVVTNVKPLESVVVMAIPPATRLPMVEATLRPDASVTFATTTVAVLTGPRVEVTVLTARVAAAEPLCREVTTVTVVTSEFWESAAAGRVSAS